ncbi:hypothetical protein [uncultured Dokdonia sp.]|uniref:hypothetical protein n=1 Tax=uncultured Dokdonia sp. TaxID=575653 RepID=UPI002633CA03|nr:hypothetical protein [uncultured Dokdonia sp.]
MKKITHEHYLDKHSLEVAHLPSDIQDKIGVFGKMLGLEKDLEGQDAQELDRQLQELDTEILLDIKQVKKLHKEHNADQSIAKETRPKPDAQKKSQYEDTLQGLIDQKKHKNILRSTLRELGIALPLSKVTIIGKYCITRTCFFTYRYSISVMTT